MSNHSSAYKGHMQKLEAPKNKSRQINQRNTATKYVGRKVNQWGREVVAVGERKWCGMVGRGSRWHHGRMANQVCGEKARSKRKKAGRQQAGIRTTGR